MRTRPLVAGLVTALVGSTSSFAVVLAGLRAVGASPAQAASGLLVLFLTMGLGTALLAVRTRLPVTLAWSTPGSALLVGTGAVVGGWPAAIGAFLVSGLLICLTAAWPGLGRLIGRIPTPLAQAMLAGVLVPLCLAPVRAAVSTPLLTLPVIVVWLVLQRLAPRWATPAAFALALVVVGLEVALRPGAAPAVTLLPHPVWTTPSFALGAVIGVALPLYVVTMAAQNVPGVAVLASYGYRTPWRPSMAVTGVGTLLGAPFGGHAINLAAITAALSASPEADPDPAERWRAARTAGLTYVVLGLLSPALVGLITTGPEGPVEAAAGLGLLPVLAGALTAALDPPPSAPPLAGVPAPVTVLDRIPSALTFLVAAGGSTVLGIGPAFWALVTGLVAWALLRARRRPQTPSAA
ncbi:benzoate membrane transport protein [Friedmanniella endophytica]|uniref:Benzoate membrane transport protein n=1 Tax=Microlunatus kandeliicorticis TaxID=1759536 RepID=A0A7W3P4W8_9ACTN|nr:benzoate/H(+) symporter BenE family transporter [Microlunatus kandeliicorticis]MBA8793275.1 benzoate membrane transport protein [Microlunatus kandeliicorticis]